MFALSVVDIYPVVSDDPPFRPFRDFQCLSCLAGASRCYDNDSLTSDIDASAVYRVRVLRLFENRGSHSKCPALALTVVFSVEEEGLMSLGAVERRPFMAFYAECSWDTRIDWSRFTCLLPVEGPEIV